MSRSYQRLRVHKEPEREFVGSCLRTHHTMVHYRKYLYVFGGHEGEVGGPLNALWKYSLERRRWYAVITPQGKKPSRREGHSAVVYRTGMYVYGGHRGVSFYSDLQRFDFETRLWTKMDEQSWSTSLVARFGHAAVVARDRMWVIGGFLRDDNPAPLASYSFTWVTWSHHEAPSAVHGNSHTKPVVAAAGDNLIVAGLYPEPARSGDILVFNMVSETWREISPKTHLRPDSFTPWVQQYATSTFCPKSKKLLIFSYRPRKKTALTNDWAMHLAVCSLSLGDLDDVRWASVFVEGVKMPKVVPAPDYNVKFATCMVGDKIYINGGTTPTERIMFYMTLVDEDPVGSRLVGTSSTNTIIEGRVPHRPKVKSIVSFGNDESRRQEKRHSNSKPALITKRADDEGFCVPFSKELVFPASVPVDSTTPVVRLRTAEEIRLWQESIYALQKKWLMETWDECKHDDLRRKEAEKNTAKDELRQEVRKKRLTVASPLLGALGTFDKCTFEDSSEPTATSNDDDIHSWKMGRTIMITRNQIVSDELPDDSIKSPLGMSFAAKRWDAVRKCIFGVNRFMQTTTDTIHRMQRASIVAIQESEDITPGSVPTRRRSSVASVVSGSERSFQSSPCSSRPASVIGSVESFSKRRGRRRQVQQEDLPFGHSRLQQVREVRKSIQKPWQTLENCGLIPTPPLGTELQHCLAISATTRDPHLHNL